MSNTICPRCDSENIVKNGNTTYGKAKFMCKDCRKHFVKNPVVREISDEKKELIDRLLLEKIPPAGIARTVQVSLRWLYSYVEEKYRSVEKEIRPVEEEVGEVEEKVGEIEEEVGGVGEEVGQIEEEEISLTIQCDEMHSFVGNKRNKYWIWLAINESTREIVGVYIGARDRNGAQGLWDSLPPVYQQHAVIYTDFWKSYNEVFPQERHIPVGKNTGKTSYIERFNNTMRQRISRPVRKTLSFSKKLENHTAAIWLFVHHYNSVIKKEITTAT